MEVETRMAAWVLLVLAFGLPAAAQAPLSISTAEPYHFIAVHGKRSAVFGYAGRAPQVWGYPFLILDRYTVDFQPQRSPAVLRGANLLTPVKVRADSVTRMWTGTGFQVTETAFVPSYQAAAILRYHVSGRTPVSLVIHFRPV